MCLKKYENSSNCVMYLIASFFSKNQMSCAENHSLMRSTKFDPIIFFYLRKKSQYLETFKGGVTIYIFLQKKIYFGQTF